MLIQRNVIHFSQNILSIPTCRKDCSWHQDIMSPTWATHPFCFRSFDHKVAKPLIRPSSRRAPSLADVVPWHPVYTTSLCCCLGVLARGEELAHALWHPILPWLSSAWKRSWAEQRQSNPFSTRSHSLACETKFHQICSLSTILPSFLYTSPTHRKISSGISFCI